MRKRLALLLAFALMAGAISNTAILARASEGSADDPYKLILTEEPKPSSGSRKAAGEEAAAAAAAEAAAQGENAADTSDPYKGTGGDNADPYKGTGGDNADPYKGTGGGNADPYKGTGGDAAAAAPAAAVPEVEKYVPEPGEGAKYTVTVTPDNWVKIENEGGKTLGLSQTSGVKIIEEEGLAFKDLNQNGSLDVYEDWRKPVEERAQDLADQMKGEEKALMLAHGGWDGPFTTEPLAADDASAVYLRAGGRGGVTRAISNGGGAHAKWTNALQEVAESCLYGIPAMISIDPSNISGLVESVSLASTMDPELAAEIGKETAKQYRAAGVTALLGPQVDISSPIMSRAGGTYGEDPQLTLDIATAYVNAMQSTYDENGEDLGWGPESVYCFTKHYGGAGSTEGGRDDHTYGGRYTVFPGENLEAHLITYFDGVFNLPGKTGSSGIMTEYAINVDKDGNPFGGEYAGAYNEFMYSLLDEVGYDSLKITDWGVFGGLGEKTGGLWGTESLSEPERVALGFERGVNILGGYGGYGGIGAIAEGYNVLAGRIGEEEANAILTKAAYNYIVVMMNLGMFEQPYNDSAYADSIIFSADANAFGQKTQDQSVVMIKNDGVLTGEAKTEKPKVYVPYVYSTGFSASWMMGVSEGTPSWAPGLDLDVLGQYFDVVTDTVGAATGEAGADGNPTFTKEDITRATAEQIADCDYILVGMTGAYSASYNSHLQAAFGAPRDVTGIEEFYYPPSLQYAEYTADTARDPSISGNTVDGVKENRSYKGRTAPADPNYGHLEALQYANEIAGDIPVIAAVSMERGMVWTEVEPLCDVIFVSYNAHKTDAIARMILGQAEPNGLLVFQQPASMEAIDAQVDDVPRDMECYKDAAGNTYDFAFGMNWSGVIDDARTQKYSAAPLTKVQSHDFGDKLKTAAAE